ncbi:1-aminocyclopropane-1-carboxylate deaminase/D-cysteine desulfhydrase [Ferruginibacter yonginensis]|uniref:1-aminocyclopropane-1-carboxylate deaminase/D-cysteine desulfhydrase n=1 Tax=Ferruginibacter yonginensis TaxID=1310416 RepID=A0ABV8QQ40_9BACT
MQIPYEKISIDNITTNYTIAHGVTLHMVRFDKIHNIVSGNKLFKLYHYLNTAAENKVTTIVTFGGAFSNHLVATAFACKQQQLKSIGIVRGEKPKNISHTLQQCIAFGMELQFISRNAYKNYENNEIAFAQIKNTYDPCLVIPEGGYGVEGCKGAGLMYNFMINHNPTHICCAVGTATTFAGLVKNNKHNNVELIAVPVIKNMMDLDDRIRYLTQQNHGTYTVFNDAHFGGYAKHPPSLIAFMNKFYEDTNIETDIVYTSKMMYAVIEKIKAGYFKKGSKIFCVHTGGLQGNNSLPSNMLNF